MAKKNKKEPKIRKTGTQGLLPQNFVHVGESDDGDKKIYISQPVYKEIHRFTKNKTVNESGGMLIGSVTEEFGKHYIIISGFIEAKHSEATPTTLTFTHATWDHCHKELEKRFAGKKIVGWIHTHPNFGIFLSEYDKFIQQNFFNQENQVAYVIDPIQKEQGFYIRENGKIERCKGFYIFDKSGVKINAVDKTGKPETSDEKGGKLGFWLGCIALVGLSACVIMLAIINHGLNKEVEKLRQEQQSYTQYINELYYQNQALASEIEQLKSGTQDGQAGTETSDTESQTQSGGTE